MGSLAPVSVISERAMRDRILECFSSLLELLFHDNIIGHLETDIKIFQICDKIGVNCQNDIVPG